MPDLKATTNFIQRCSCLRLPAWDCLPTPAGKNHCEMSVNATTLALLCVASMTRARGWLAAWTIGRR